MWQDLHDRLGGFVARRVADPHAADDLAQDILLRIYQRMGELRDEERLDAWAYQVARRAIIDHYRSRAASRERPDAAAIARIAERDSYAITREQDSDEVRAEIAGCLAPMVSDLPAPYRQAIELTDLGGMTQTAAADRLGLSVPGMKARVQRGRHKLREMLFECCRVATDSRGAPIEVEARDQQGPEVNYDSKSAADLPTSGRSK